LCPSNRAHLTWHPLTQCSGGHSGQISKSPMLLSIAFMKPCANTSECNGAMPNTQWPHDTDNRPSWIVTSTISSKQYTQRPSSSSTTSRIRQRSPKPPSSLQQQQAALRTLPVQMHSAQLSSCRRQNLCSFKMRGPVIWKEAFQYAKVIFSRGKMGFILRM